MAYTTIDDPSAHFQVKTYSGNSTQTAITFDGSSNLQPDWIWAKQRGGAHYHDLRDTNRGLTKRLVSAISDGEGTKSASYVSFDSNGFTLGDDQSGGSDANTVNSNGNTYVSWCWKANGGTTSSNSNGSITTTVQANTTAGFSIVTWTGTGSNATIGHGLGVTPKWIIVKQRNATRSWEVFHSSIPSMNTKYIELNTTAAASTYSPVWGGTDPTSTTFHVGTDNSTNNNSGSFIAYCFAEKKGYSKFGSYTGNGSTDGTFIYTGFRPAWFMYKSTSSVQNWIIQDNKRANSFNEINADFRANVSDAENTNTSYNDIDFLSNGIKLREDNNDQNQSGGTYIYMAFAESPFVNSNGVPTNAR